MLLLFALFLFCGGYFTAYFDLPKQIYDSFTAIPTIHHKVGLVYLMNTIYPYCHSFLIPPHRRPSLDRFVSCLWFIACIWFHWNGLRVVKRIRCVHRLRMIYSTNCFNPMKFAGRRPLYLSAREQLKRRGSFWRRRRRRTDGFTRDQDRSQAVLAQLHFPTHNGSWWLLGGLEFAQFYNLCCMCGWRCSCLFLWLL